MIPFCNNLKKGDIVEDSGSGRRGVVAAQPRESSTNVMIKLDGLAVARYFPVMQLRLVVDGVAEGVPPVNGEPTAKEKAILRRDSEKTEEQLLREHQTGRFEAGARPVIQPPGPQDNGTHIKHYIINYIDQQGNFHVERVAAKGIVTAITMFYMQKNETAIVSVICVL